MSVEILIDPFGVSNAIEGDAVVLGTQPEYLDACERIDRALDGGTPLRVIVRNKAMRRWFDHYRNRLEVAIRKCDPRDMMADALGISSSTLPAVLRQDPEAIVTLELIGLSKRCRPTEGQELASWVLGNVLGEPWGMPSIESVSDLDSLLAYLTKSAETSPPHPTLIALQQEVVSCWSQKGPFSQIVRWLLAQESTRRAEALIVARLMQKYPFGTRVDALRFEGRWAELSQLEDLDAIVARLGLFDRDGFVMPAGPNNVIRRYLAAQLEESGLKGILPAMSGRIAEEEKVVRTYLREKVGEIDDSWEQDLTALRRVFAQSESARQLLEMISELKPPAEPSLVPADASWAEVTSWLDEQYLPYYRWAVAAGRIEKTQDTARSFERWLIRNFDSLTRTDALLAAYLRGRIAEGMAGGACLVVIIDALPWSLYPYVAKLAPSRGLTLLESEPKLSVIPTLTEVSKPCLVRGQLPGQVQTAGAGTSYYHDLLSESTGLAGDQIACGSANETSLFDLVRSRKVLMLYLFNNADELVHKRLQPDRRRERIEDELLKLFDDLAEACRESRDQTSQSIAVLIVSDHGYTEMPRVVGESLPVPDGYLVSHGRVAVGPANDVRESDGVHLISPQLVGGGEKAYVVASGYDCLGSRPHGASHGGLTPQEVVVPFLVVSCEAGIEFRDLELAVTGSIRRGRSRNAVQITIVNANTTRVSIEHLSLRLTKIAEEGPWPLGPGDKVQIGGEVDASSVRSRSLQLAGTLAVLGPVGLRNAQICVDFETTGAAIADAEFEKDFDL